MIEQVNRHNSAWWNNSRHLGIYAQIYTNSVYITSCWTTPEMQQSLKIKKMLSLLMHVSDKAVPIQWTGHYYLAYNKKKAISI